MTRMTNAKWRSVRAQVRWNYMKYDYTPPRAIAHYVEQMPEDSWEWKQFADAVYKHRRANAQRVRRNRDATAEAQHTIHRREYMKNYMKTYRARSK